VQIKSIYIQYNNNNILYPRTALVLFSKRCLYTHKYIYISPVYSKLYGTRDRELVNVEHKSEKTTKTGKNLFTKRFPINKIILSLQFSFGHVVVPIKFLIRRLYSRRGQLSHCTHRPQSKTALIRVRSAELGNTNIAGLVCII